MKHPVHESEVAAESWYVGTNREIRGKPLCDVGGKANVGFGLMELPPGSNTRPGHWHSKEEEHLYVLSGHATLHLGAEQFALRPGSYVCFPAKQAAGHCLENNGSESLVYIIVGERIKDDEVTYPTSVA
jgi:uncharacterized cupin superfamily protein